MQDLRRADRGIPMEAPQAGLQPSNLKSAFAEKRLDLNSQTSILNSIFSLYNKVNLSLRSDTMNDTHTNRQAAVRRLMEEEGLSSLIISDSAALWT